MRLRIPSLLLLTALTATAADETIRDIGHLEAFYAQGEFGIIPLELSGQVIRHSATGDGNEAYILENSEGRCEFFYNRSPALATGDVVRIRGQAVIGHGGERHIAVREVAVTGKAPLPPPLPIALRDLSPRLHDFRTVIADGTVIDLFKDDVDSRYAFLILKDGETILPVAADFQPGLSEQLLDSRIRVTGIYHRTVQGERKFSGPFISANTVDILLPPPQDPFNVPRLESSIYLTPHEVAALGRRRVDGEVLVTWDDTHLMVRQPSGRIVNVTLVRSTPLPPCGASVTAVGYPETDLFRLNLSRARVRVDADAADASPVEAPADVTPADILTRNGQERINDLLHGCLIRLRGIVRALPSEGGRERRILLDCGDSRVPVDLGSNPSAADRLLIGCEIEATGRCLIESENWRTDNVFPRIRGFSVVIRTPADIRILRRPPWWTPARLLTVIVGLLAALLAILVWNRLLQRLVERRGRELYRAEIAKAGSELRVDERTRLAVELHDTVSQNLTGIALEINAGEYDLAQKTLKACREELKNCIWDLRNNALEEANLNDAIRRTLAPHLGDTRLAVRFNVPRTRFTDNTAHALLRIIRELAVNAIRHGQAKEIRVAGAFEGDRLLFSVADDGCGFDPATAPGMDKGHFGLVGVRERVESFNGDLHIESAPGRGTKVSICLKSKC